MRFKQWLEMAGSPVMHGGIEQIPGGNLNLNMPVASKISTKDGTSGVGPDSYDDKIKPDKLFKLGRNADVERRSQWIDTARKRNGRMVTVPPDTA